jgi:hypothetical protein
MFQDLFHSDNAKVNATDVLNHDSMKENKKYDKLQAPCTPDAELPR